MSWQHVEAAGEIELKRPPVKAVLLVLAHHAQHYNNIAWPGLPRICTFTGLGRRTVQLAIKELEDLGLVRVKRGSGKTVSVYTLHLPGVEQKEIAEGTPPGLSGAGDAPLPKSRGESAAPQGRRTCASEVQEPHPNSNRKILNESPDARAAMPEFNEDWQPPVGTIERIKKDEGLSDEEIERERQMFVLKNLETGEPVRNPPAAFRVWCARLKSLKHPPKPPPRAKRKESEIDKLRRCVETWPGTIDLYKRMHRDDDAAELERKLVAAKAELAQLEHA